MPPKPPRPPPRPEPYRATRPKADAERERRQSRPLGDMPLDERRAELVRAYVAGEALPSDPPSDPPPSESDPPDVDTSAPRLVQVPPDMTLRPRRTIHQKIKDAHKAWIGIAALGAAIVGGIKPVFEQAASAYRWVDGVNQAMTSASACASAQKANAAALEQLRGELRGEWADAGVAQGKNWDQQDEINLNVHRQLTRLRPQTPPPALGPKAKAQGRQ